MTESVNEKEKDLFLKFECVGFRLHSRGVQTDDNIPEMLDLWSQVAILQWKAQDIRRLIHITPSAVKVPDEVIVA